MSRIVVVLAIFFTVAPTLGVRAQMDQTQTGGGRA